MEAEKQKKYILGLDIGISSVGWALIKLNDKNEPYKIEDTGVKIFQAGENAKTGESLNLTRREKRGSRRVIRRRQFRVNMIRLLLSDNDFIKKSNGKLLSDVFDDLKIEYNTLLDNYYKDKDTNPYILRKEGLERCLTNEELSIILVHYAKYRGYKSNRDEDESESGKVNKAIKENEALMQAGNYQTISQMYVCDEKFKDRIHNSNGEYKLSVTRAQVLEDIEKVLNKQIEFGLINEKFKTEYINIWGQQRHYSKGPGYYYTYDKEGNREKKISPYGGNLIEKMTGKCLYTGEARAPKCAPSSEMFNALNILNNTKYKNDGNSEYKSFSEEEINKILLKAYETGNITYANIKKILNNDRMTFKGLEKYKNNKLLSKTIIKMPTLNIFRKKLSAAFGREKWQYLLNNIEILDEIAIILTNLKTEEEIVNAVKKNELIDDIYIDAILELPNLKDHNKLSLSLIRKLNELMKKGMIYSDAMVELGYNEFNVVNSNKEKSDLLIPINYGNEITNQRVIRSLSQTRKIINSIIKKYGMPYQINIETARELAKSFDERKKIKNQQEDNKSNNDKIKQELFEKLPNIFKNINKITSTDILKYKLWQEQENTCAYSLEKIKFEELYENNIVQIDHILPYSRTYDDSYFNKTLVKTKYNQEKGNRTPLEWLSGDKKNEYIRFINSLNISNRKKDNYLLAKLTNEIENDMRNQNLNDTKYITKYLASYLKAFLNVSKINTVSGAITSKLRGRWGLNNITHSLQSETYYLKDSDESNDINKNRENHLHHAMDACIIACTNASLIKKVTNYEKYKRYFENRTSADIDSLIKNNYIVIDKNDNYIDNETGELIEIDSLKDYYNNLINNNYLVSKSNNRFTVLFPKPYENFTDEVKARIYERNEKNQKEYLKMLKTYSEEEIKSIMPLIPVFDKQKIKGALHKETLYGIKKINDKQYTTERISVISNTFDLRKLEKFKEFDIENGSTEVYNTLKSWLSDYKNGDEAYKNLGYPKDKTGKLIKKIKIRSEYTGGGHIVKNSLVGKENIQKILVFKNNETEELYFSGLDKYDVIQLKNNKNYKIVVWKSTSIKEDDIFDNIIKKYNLFMELYKNDLIKITKNDGSKGLCYVVGFSQGKLEIGSYLGDEYDLVIDNKLFNKFYSGGQYPVTISTIKNIKKVKLTNLGKIE